jgi:hypothetical protein
MGIVNFGIPTEQVKWLKKVLKLKIFIEGGTYFGGTAKEMAQYFEHVYTIEKSKKMYLLAQNNLRKCKNVTLLKGDTREYLNEIIDKNDNLLFWLDAHWSGGDTYGADDECPLMEELEIIFKSNKNFIILIDDARLFLSPPPLPHKLHEWPTYNDIIRFLPQNWTTMVYEDVIYIYPDKISNELNLQMQMVATKIHNKGKQNSWTFGKDFFQRATKFFNN